VRILLLHPEDVPDHGPWFGKNWDIILDLGKAGAGSHDQWAEKLGRRVRPLEPRGGVLDYAGVLREFLFIGRGRLVDSEGLDWWSLLSTLFYQKVMSVAAVRSFASTIGSQDELFVTRPCLAADVLQLFVGGRLRVLSGHGEKRRASHYAALLRKFSPAQLMEFFWDKNDPDYHFRRRFGRLRASSRAEVVLLPSAYVNVSRTGIAYAQIALEQQFLLVTTRQSGWVQNLPKNVAAAKLASYAGEQSGSEIDSVDILDGWQVLKRELDRHPETQLCAKLGFFETMPTLIQNGLAIRNAWRTVFNREPVKAVLCADDSNPYTRLPLLLANRRGIPTISCHHGALDGLHAAKSPCAGTLLAKGQMEKDYLVRVCCVPVEKIEIGAPQRLSAHTRPRPQNGGSYIVFFSEPYKVYGGRPEEFYRDILPPLADLALGSGKTLLIKLHPFESRRERQRLVKKALSPRQWEITKLVAGPLDNALLQDAWFGVTVLSTASMECVLAGVPCFLCTWLEHSPFQYARQFIKFGAGIALDSPAQISNIPEMIVGYRTTLELASNLWQPIEPRRLRELFEGAPRACVAAAG
jgi:hypothetical protein